MDFSVLVTNTPVFDKAFWQLWLLGLTVEQAAVFMNRRRPTLHCTPAALRHYVTSQYRTYELLEPYLHRPKLLATTPPLLFPLCPETRTYLIETFYTFHPSVMRQVLGKKFSSRVRKDLEDVCSKTRVPIAGCRRMFDNFKRVTKVVEDSERDLGAVIMREFLLPKALAEQYAHIIFINNYRFDTFKRKLAHIRFADYDYVASILMHTFSHPTLPVLDDLDTTLSQDARDIKQLLFAQKGAADELRNVIATRLASPSPSPSPIPPTTTTITTTTAMSPLHHHLPHLSSPSSPPPSPTPLPVSSIASTDRNFDATFKTVLRGVLAIGTALSHRKDLRDVFLLIQERVVDPCLAAGWTVTDLEAFLGTVRPAFLDMRTVSVVQRK
ncbi:hypothetical protein HKX48_001726, partial [Thoreauomyces humboldtii]